MLLIVDEEISESVKKLSTFSTEVVQEFCGVAVECIFKESYNKIFSSAATKLGVETECVKQTIEGLMKFYIEAAKQHVTEQTLQITLKTFDLPKEYEDTILNEYLKNETRIQDSLQNRGSIHHRYYNDCLWRLDVKLASRSLHQQVEPKILLKLETTCNDNVDNNVSKTGNNESILLQATPTNLIHVTRCLEDALREIQNTPTYYKRITKNL